MIRRGGGSSIIQGWSRPDLGPQEQVYNKSYTRGRIECALVENGEQASYKHLDGGGLGEMHGGGHCSSLRPGAVIFLRTTNIAREKTPTRRLMVG